ncbi:MAG: 30S ribosomal protein S6 [Puniceicoccales bacterium]|jgi:ribosomal protein S6|nr:30S ribosomal protein S6 [Puniceicoccales bacterium]
MQKKYKVTLVLDNREQGESTEDIMGRISGYVEFLGGTVEKLTNLGVLDFQRYTNRQFRAGIYVQYVIQAEGNFNTEFNNRLRLDKSVDRALIEKF